MDCVTDGFEQYLKKTKQASTTYAYMRSLEQFKASLLDTPLLDVSPDQVMRFLTQGGEGADGPLRSQWNMRLSALRTLYAYLHTSGLIADKLGPTKGFSFHKLHKKEVIPLNYTELFRILDVIDSGPKRLRGRNKAIVLTLFHCGMRVSELVSLDVGQIDSEAQVLFGVPRKGGFRFSSDLNEIALQAMRVCGDERALLLEGKEECDALFLSRDGKRLSVRRVQSLIHELGEAAGIKRPVTPHLFRHSYASHLYEVGVDLLDIQKALGHQNLETTLSYIHPIPNNGSSRQRPNDRLGACWEERHKVYLLEQSRAVAFAIPA